MRKEKGEEVAELNSIRYYFHWSIKEKHFFIETRIANIKLETKCTCRSCTTQHCEQKLESVCNPILFLIELVLVLVVKCLSCKSLPSKVVVIPTSCRGPSTFSTWIYEMLIRLKRTKDNEAKSWIKFQWKIFLLQTDKDSCRVVSSFFYLVYVRFKNLLYNFMIKQVNIDWKMNFVVICFNLV